MQSWGLLKSVHFRQLQTFANELKGKSDCVQDVVVTVTLPVTNRDALADTSYVAGEAKTGPERKTKKKKSNQTLSVANRQRMLDHQAKSQEIKARKRQRLLMQEGKHAHLADKRGHGLARVTRKQHQNARTARLAKVVEAVDSTRPCRFYLTDADMQRVQSSIVLPRGVDQKISRCPHSECCRLHSEEASSMNRDSLIARRLRI